MDVYRGTYIGPERDYRGEVLSADSYDTFLELTNQAQRDFPFSYFVEWDKFIGSNFLEASIHGSKTIGEIVPARRPTGRRIKK
jgi:hypothetical protein